MELKTVYWRIRSHSTGSYKVEFWKKEDEKDLLTEEFVILDEERLRFRIGMVTGLKNFELIQVKGKRG
jgi:hypothetical protein